VANTQTYILDRHLQPVAVGMVGELYLGGEGLARGYLHAPALTAEKFIPNPFGGEPGGRLYKTGDLARYRPDGTIECLGRMDHQVKVRGYRIELGEIEATLGRHPSVREAVVLVRKTGLGVKRLVAYVVLQWGVNLSQPELRQFVQAHLPEYMVPSFFVVLPEMPLMPNGKLHREALPEVEALGLEAEPHQAPPRNPVETILTRLWAEVLGLKTVGVYDHFFELGGHSLQAAQVVSRIRSTFGINVPLRALFECPTVEKLGALILGPAATRKQVEAIASLVVSVDQLPEEDLERMLNEQETAKTSH
jgi:acyl carrier protein